MDVVQALMEMGFTKTRAELAASKTNSDLAAAAEWLLTHEEESVAAVAPAAVAVSSGATANVQEAAVEESAEAAQLAKSIKCDDCGKLFSSQTEVEFHAAKSGHEHFSESTEEKKPLTEEEKREQLAKIETKLRQRRLEREEREKQEALEREKKRIRSGKEMLEAKKKQDDLEIKKMVEQRKREKEEARVAKQRVMDQIEQDKQARKAKFENAGPNEKETPPSPVAATAITQPTTSKPVINYTDVKLQIRLTNGSTMTQSFGAKEPLSAVRLYIEMNRSDEPAPFTLMTNYPKKVFKGEDYEKPLDILGLAPSAVLIVQKV